MTYLDSLRGVRAATVESPAVPLTTQTLVDLLVGPATEAGVTVTPKGAIGLPAVFRSIALIAGSTAALPLHAFVTEGEARKRVTPQPPLIVKPHPDLTPFEWRELVLVHLLGWGNAYLWKVRNKLGVVVELWPIDPARVSPGRARTGEKVYAVDRDPANDRLSDEQRYIPLTDREILHIPALGYDGVKGLSPIGVARVAVGTAMATERHGARFFGSGTMLSGVLSTEAQLTPAQADLLKARWKDSNGGLDNSHDVAVLGNGTSFTPISISPVDAQFIETQKFGVQQVARLYGVPPHMLMDTEKSTSWGTGIEQQGIGFVTYTLQSNWLVRIEQRLDRLLEPEQYLRHNVAGLLRGDTKGRFDAYAVGRQWGWLSVNDVRRLEDMEPVENGDGYMQPLNMTAIGASPASPDPLEGTTDA